MSDFNKIHPALFGSILDTLSGAMRAFPDVQLKSLPRMADFAKWGFAIADELGIGGDTFLKHYHKNTKLQHYEVVHNDPVSSSVIAFAEALGEYEGTATELQLRCKEHLSEDEAKDKSWPKTAAHFSRRLKQVSHNLRELDVIVEFSRGKERMITVKYKP